VFVEGARRWSRALCLSVSIMKSNFKLLLLFVPLVPLLAPGSLRAAPPPKVIVAEAKEKDFSDRIEALGTLRAAESVELTATLTERVTFIGFEDGQRVKKGEVLLKLSSSEEEALLSEVEATAEEARQQFERIDQLATQGAASQSQLDEVRRNFETAKARQLAIQSRLANLIILAPFDGVVGLRNISIGALVRPGDLITTIDADQIMLLDFSIPSTFLPVVNIGDKIQAASAGYDGRKFEGEIRSISSRVDPVTRTVLIRAEIPNEELVLKPGLLMTVELYSNSRQAVVIPEEALLPAGFGNSVMVVEEAEGKKVARRRPVEIGGRERGKVEILGGLKAGERVITHGALKTGEGSEVGILAVDDGETELSQVLQTGGSK